MTGLDRRSRVAIIDYGVGNLYSVEQACRHVGLAANITSDPQMVRSASGVILPGVGAFAFAMDQLRNLGMVEALKDVVAEDKPLMGVCLGFQLLFDYSTEMGETKGLGVIAGGVSSLRECASLDLQSGVVARLPNVGWLEITPASRLSNQDGWVGTCLEGVSDKSHMYFVHSYFVTPEDPGVQLAEATYHGYRFCSAIERGNIFGCQFHPEKSNKAGLQVYRNFAHRLT